MIINAHDYLFPTDLPMASHTLSDNSWQTIRQVCKAGKAADYWSVGQTKTAGGYTCTLLDFDKDGENTMTFSLGQVSSSASIACSTFSPSYVYDPTEVDFFDCRYYDNVLAPIQTNLPSELSSVITQATVSYNQARSGGSTILTARMKLFPPAASDMSKYSYGLLVRNAWTRDAYTYSHYNGINGVRTIIKFYMIGSTGQSTNDGYTDKWNYAGETGRSGTTTANLELLFVI